MPSSAWGHKHADRRGYCGESTRPAAGVAAPLMVPGSASALDSGAEFSVGPICAVPNQAIAGRFAEDWILGRSRQAKASNEVLTATQKTFARALLAIGMAGALSLLLFVEVPGNGLWHRALLDSAHGPIFAAVAVLLLLMRAPEARTRRSAYVIAFVAAVVLGILIESSSRWAAARVRVRRHDRRGGRGGRPRALEPVQAATRKPRHGQRLPSPWQASRSSPGRPLQAAHAYAHRAVVSRPSSISAAAKACGSSRPKARPPGSRPCRRLGRRRPTSARCGSATMNSTSRPCARRAEPDWRGYSVVAVDITNPGDARTSARRSASSMRRTTGPRGSLNLPLVIPPQTRTTVRVTLAAVESAPAGRRMDLARIADVMLFGRDGRSRRASCTCRGSGSNETVPVRA